MMNQSGLDQILSQCARLMAKRGFHGTAMRDLAHTTGRSLSGLYHYFENKEQLLYLINQRGFSSLLKTAREVHAQKLSPEQTLYALIDNHVRYFAGHTNEMRVMMFGTLALGRARQTEISALKNDYAGLVSQAVAHAHHACTGADLDAAALSRKTFFLFGMMNWIYGWYSSAEHGSRQVLVDDIFHTFIGGLQNTHDAEAAA